MMNWVNMSARMLVAILGILLMAYGWSKVPPEGIRSFGTGWFVLLAGILLVVRRLQNLREPKSTLAAKWERLTSMWLGCASACIAVSGTFWLLKSAPIPVFISAPLLLGLAALLIFGFYRIITFDPFQRRES